MSTFRSQCCTSCSEKDEIIVSLQHLLREERHVLAGLEFALKQVLDTQSRRGRVDTHEDHEDSIDRRVGSPL